MSNKTFTLKYKGKVDRAQVHRFRNFAEDLQRKLLKAQLGNTSDPDVATDSLQVSISAKQHLGAPMNIVKKCLEEHFLTDWVEFE